MKYIAWLIVPVLLLASCRERAAPEEPVQPSKAEVARAIVPNPVSAQPADPAMLERLKSAEWTRHDCNLGTVDNAAPEAALAKAYPHMLEGFLLGSDGAVAGDFFVVLKGKSTVFTLPASTGKSRPDVAMHFKDTGLVSAGFQLGVSLADMPTGDYEVLFLMDKPNGWFFCESGKQLHLVDAE
jgi:hypothetical protein